MRHPDGQVRFQALTFKGSQVDVMRHVEGLLAENDVVAIEVRSLGQHLFTLGSDLAGG